MTTKVKPTVEKWEPQFNRIVNTYYGEASDGKQKDEVIFEPLKVIDQLKKLFRKTLAHSVQEAKAEMVEKIEKIMDKDRAKEIGDNIEIAFGERSCKVCGYNPEYQREYILASLKQEEEKA